MGEEVIGKTVVLTEDTAYFSKGELMTVIEIDEDDLQDGKPWFLLLLQREFNEEEDKYEEWSLEGQFAVVE